MGDAARDPAFDRLDVLVGDWEIEATHPQVEGVMRGRGTFEWLPGRAFLIHRTEMQDPTPSSISIIGGGDTPGTWPMHYFDRRGVMRVYQVTLEKGVWRIRRDHPGFSQRFSGTFDDGGRTIRGQWDVNEDGSWKSDLRVTYVRRS